MDFYKVPIGFGLALSANTAAMNRYAHLAEDQKQEILNKAHNVRRGEEFQKEAFLLRMIDSKHMRQILKIILQTYFYWKCRMMTLLML